MTIEFDQPKEIIKLAKIFDKAEIPYMVTGAQAVAIYGRPRPSFDIDVVVKGKPEYISKSVQYAGYNLNSNSSDYKDFLEFESSNGLRIDLWLMPKIKFEEDKFKRRKKFDINGYSVYFISPEDLILKKLWRYRQEKLPKDIDDIRGILEAQHDTLDFSYIDNTAKILRAYGLFKALKKEISKVEAAK